MILNKSKSNRKDRGFTIVELLVVIVVIGILAAITIVSYTGFTARAKTSQSQSNANSAMQVIAAYVGDQSGAPNNGGNGTYPADAGIAAALAGYSLAKLPSGVTLTLQSATNPASGDGANQVWYKLNTLGTGACIGYWDTAAATDKYIYMGTATSDAKATPTCT